MMRGIDRANGFTWGVIAMLAEHGKKGYFFHVPRVMITLHVQPGHLPALNDSFQANHPQAILRVTGDGTRATADASIQIHHHGPTVRFVFVDRIDIPFSVIAFWQRERKRKRIHGESSLLVRSSMIEFL
jgi:hypothetical protein